MRIRVSILAFLASGMCLYAQGGSNYSGLGLGDVRRIVGAQFDAIGGTAIAMPTHHSVNIVNPALLGQIASTRLQVGYRFQQSTATQGSNSIAQNNGEIDGVLGLFSIDTSYKFGMTIGLIPLTSINYATSHTISNVTADVTGTSVRTGQGGSSALILGAGSRIFNNVTLGIMAQAVFGTSLYIDQVNTAGTGTFGVASSVANEMRAFLIRTGVYLPINDQFSLGAIFAFGGNGSVNVTNRVVSLGSGVVVTDTTQKQSISTPMPMTLGFGASYMTNGYRIGLDVERSDFSNVVVNTRPDVTFGSTFHTSIGVTHAGSDFSTSSWLERCGYHVGAGYDRSYITYNGATIADTYVAGGVDFPIGGTAIVDAAITAGIRAVSNSSFIQESFARVTVTLSMGDTWFKPLARE